MFRNFLKRFKRILIVEDDQLLAEAYEGKLKKAGYNVYVEHNGREGLRTAFKKLPHLIVLDLALPKMDGETFLKELRATGDVWGENVPVLVISTLFEDENLRRKYKIADYIKKTDWEFGEVIEKIENAIG